MLKKNLLSWGHYLGNCFPNCFLQNLLYKISPCVLPALLSTKVGLVMQPLRDLMFSITRLMCIQAEIQEGIISTWWELSVWITADANKTPASTNPTTKGQINEALVFREKQIYLLHLHISRYDRICKCIWEPVMIWSQSKLVRNCFTMFTSMTAWLEC